MRKVIVRLHDFNELQAIFSSRNLHKMRATRAEKRHRTIFIKDVEYNFFLPYEMLEGFRCEIIGPIEFSARVGIDIGDVIR